MRKIYALASKVLPKSTFGQLRRWKNLKSYSSRFDEAIQQFVLKKGVTNPSEVNRIKKRLVRAFIKDNWYPEEYFQFRYEYLSRKGVHEFVTNLEGNSFWEFMNPREMYLLTCDKGQTYKCFKPYFHREMVSVSKDQTDSFSEFEAFYKKHPRFIAKPTYGNYGNGVRIVDSSDEKTVSALYDELVLEYPEGFIAEELIVQCKELAAFHPSSVNTVRLTTVRQSNGEIYLIHRCFLRFGQGGRCVDNAGNGGILAGLDFETGIVKGAIDEQMNRYLVHPDTGKTILGYQVPRWEEAKSLVVELAKVMPQLRYCGWDLALTDEGWIMVEANGKGLFIGFQMPTQEGFRVEFEDIKRRCGYRDE